jgi:23S rRNA (uracil1939-C5)-methyltransferase
MTVRDGRAAFRAPRSHDAVVVDGCHVAHPLLEELIVDGRFGDASEVVLRCGARTGERLAAPTPRGTEIDVPDGVADRYLHEEAAGRRWRISARSFFQTRPDGVDALADLVRTAAADLAPGHALDLFSGVGLFAGVLADRGWKVTAVEGARPSVADARVNLRGLDVAVVSADVNRWKAPVADFAVADPSRAGLGPRGARTVVASGARRVVLVSCDLGALGRDVARLYDAGYALTSATPVDFFPHTPHVEVVAVFDR